jgi:hypothetical protein
MNTTRPPMRFQLMPALTTGIDFEKMTRLREIRASI